MARSIEDRLEQAKRTQQWNSLALAGFLMVSQSTVKRMWASGELMCSFSNPHEYRGKYSSSAQLRDYVRRKYGTSSRMFREIGT